MTSTARVFAFLLWRTIAGAARRRLARLREPRYLAGGLVGALYVYFWLIGPLLHGGLRHRGSGLGFRLSPEATNLLLVLASAALAINASLFWLFYTATPVLHVSEAEVQFLAPAPLPRRALLHFSLLRTEMALLFSAFIVAWVMGRAFVPHFWQAVVAVFLVLSTLQLHALGHAFWKARGGAAPPAARRLMHAATVTAALLGLIAAAWLVAMARAAIAAALAGPAYAPAAILRALTPWTVGPVPQLLLAPFRAVLAPAFSPDTLHFMRALPSALAIVAAHYVWVVRANVRYEEAALEGARRAAARGELLSSGRRHGLPSEARRLKVPFPLPSEGRPEIAVVWKNLISRGRVRLRRAAAIWAGVLLLVLAASTAFAIAYPGTAVPVLLMIGVASAGPAVAVALALPMSYRNDFREDLEKAAVLRAWPLSPVGLAAAELAAPLGISIGASWAVLSFGAAGIAGGRLALVSNGAAWADHAGPVPTRWIAPALFALAILLPAIAAAVLLVQNAAVLAFPAWFPPGGRRPGFEATGTRLISFAATLLLLVFALTPAALVTSLVAWLTWRFLGPWSLVPAFALGSLPVWLGVAAGVSLLGRLFARFDVSSESWS